MLRTTMFLMFLLLFAGCRTASPTLPTEEPAPMDVLNTIAETYIKLVLRLGLHDADYVDAYHGPAAWRQEVERDQTDLAGILAQAQKLLNDLAATAVPGDPMLALRHNYLSKQLKSLAARASFLNGEKMSFDEECARLYDAVPPTYDAAHFQNLIAELDGLLPGEGGVQERLEHYRDGFVITKEKLGAVFDAAIAEGRRRTALHIPLPETENFVVEYVTGKAWSGYNWYQGDYQSLIQVNTDLPIYIERAVDLACHEGYPGHHVYNLLLEKHLVQERGWVEFSVYPLFSPQSLIAEGSANFGIEVAFSKAERLAFEKEVLFPLAGIDPGQAEDYYRVLDILAQLKYAGNEAARGYLDGTMSAAEAVDWLVSYALYSRERAEQRLQFIEKYRAYVINYNLGQDMVAAYVARKGGTEADAERRWRVFAELLSSPMLPSNLTGEQP